MTLLVPHIAQAAISFIDSASNSAINGGDVTVDLSGIDIQEDDLVIVGYSIGGDSNKAMSVSSPTGYIEVADLYANDSNDANLGVYYKIQGATPDSSVTVSGSAQADESTAAVAMVFRGVDTTTPMDVTPTTATGIDSADPDPPSINHNNPSGLWTVIVGASASAGGAATTYSFPTGYTTDAVSLTSEDFPFDTTLGIGYRSSGVSDPEDPGIMTWSGFGSAQLSASWGAVTIALRPVAAVVPSVDTDAASNIAITSATLNGNITDDGGESGAGTEHGFAYSTNSTLSSGVSTTTLGTYSGTGAFNEAIESLNAGETYYFRAYATNSGGTGYGSILNFTTSETPARKIRLLGDLRLRGIRLR